MVERFVYSTGTISVTSGADTVTGTGTAWGGRDRESAMVVATPAAGAPVLVGFVAAVEPRGVYEDLSLPLVADYNGSTLTNEPYVLVDLLALASGAAQAAIFARFAALLEQVLGLSGNTADDLDYALLPENSLLVDAANRVLKQWRSGSLETIKIGTPSDQKGTGTLDFGAFPGAADATLAVTGLTGIPAGALPTAWLHPGSGTADHSADEHRVALMRVSAGDVVAGTGFTIRAFAEGDGREGARHYGTWNVAWEWR